MEKSTQLKSSPKMFSVRIKKIALIKKLKLEKNWSIRILSGSIKYLKKNNKPSWFKNTVKTLI